MLLDEVKKDDYIYDVVYTVLKESNNWITYSDLIADVMHTHSVLNDPEFGELSCEDFKTWIHQSIDCAYITVTNRYGEEIKDSDYCRGEWIGLDPE